MKRSLVIPAALLCSFGALGHHSAGVYFDVDAVIELSGEITEVVWRNPHVYFIVQATDGESWNVESNSVSILRRMGLTEGLVNAGDRVQIAGWPGRHPFVAATVSRFEERGGFVELGLHLDVHADGLGPTLGLSCLAKERVAKDPRHWLDRPDLWTAFIDGLREEGLAVPEKLSALANWTTAPTTLFGRLGPFVLLRGIHHIKLVLAGDRIEQVKGYPFMALLGTPSS